MKNPAGRGEPDDNEQSPMLSVLERCCSGSPGLYLFGDQQPVRVLDGRALVQQQGLELPLLNVIESVKHNSQKLGRQERKKSAVLILILCRVSGKQGEALPAAGMLMEVGWSW